MNWKAGRYILIEDRFSPKPGVEYTFGAEVELSADDALRLGEAGSIAKPGSVQAETARRIVRGELPKRAMVSPAAGQGGISEEIERLEKEQAELAARLSQLRTVEGTTG